MPNFTVAADGTAKGTVDDPRVTLNPTGFGKGGYGKGGFGGDPNSVFANVGTALVVHANADDMKTDPPATPAHASHVALFKEAIKILIMEGDQTDQYVLQRLTETGPTGFVQRVPGTGIRGDLSN